MIAYLECQGSCILFMGYDFVANAVSPALSESIGAVTWVQSDDRDYYEQTYRLGRYCNAVVCVSAHIKARISEMNPSIGEKAEVIYNSSVVESDFSPTRSAAAVGKRDRKSTLRIIYTGRLVQYQKRILDFVALAESLDKMALPYQMTLVGDFSAREDAEALFRSRAASQLADGRISLTGRMPRERIFRELRSNDFFLLLSDFEGLPLSLIEAMACGCVPVVSYMNSGIPEIISSGNDGLIMKSRNYDEWATLLAQLWRKPGAWARISKNAQRTVRDRFTVERAADRFDDLFSRVANSICGGAYQRPGGL